MNDFEAPQLDDTAPPRMMQTVRAAGVNNADFVDYLVTQEIHRRTVEKLPPMTDAQLSTFRTELVRLAVIQGNTIGAMSARS